MKFSYSDLQISNLMSKSNVFKINRLILMKRRHSMITFFIIYLLFISLSMIAVNMQNSVMCRMVSTSDWQYMVFITLILISSILLYSFNLKMNEINSKYKQFQNDDTYFIDCICENAIQTVNGIELTLKLSNDEHRKAILHYPYKISNLSKITDLNEIIGKEIFAVCADKTYCFECFVNF